METSRDGNRDTTLRGNHYYGRGIAKGYTDKIPKHWTFSKKRIEELMSR